MKVFKNTVKASVCLNTMLLEHTVALPHDFHVEYVTQWSWISICIEGRDNECCMYFFLTIANRKNSVFNIKNKQTNKLMGLKVFTQEIIEKKTKQQTNRHLYNLRAEKSLILGLFTSSDT